MKAVPSSLCVHKWTTVLSLSLQLDVAMWQAGQWVWVKCCTCYTLPKGLPSLIVPLCSPLFSGYIQKLSCLQRREQSHRKDLNLGAIPSLLGQGGPALDYPWMSNVPACVMLNCWIWRLVLPQELAPQPTSGEPTANPPSSHAPSGPDSSWDLWVSFSTCKCEHFYVKTAIREISWGINLWSATIVTSNTAVWSLGTTL